MSTALMAARAKTKGKRLLRDALEAYGEDEYTLSEWNAIKKQAERDGKWRWKASDATATLATVKGRVEKNVNKDELAQKFATDMEAVMASELQPLGKSEHRQDPIEDDPDQCNWRERIGGKLYQCTNELHGAKATVTAPSSPDNGSNQKRMCMWHSRECTSSHHPIEKSRAIEIPNDQGYCLLCYEATAVKDRGTLQKTPPRLAANKVPGVCEVSLKRDVQREMLLRGKAQRTDKDGLSRTLTAKSKCAWEKEHSEIAYIWQCRNCVVMHPTLRGAFLPFCGYHAPRCIQEYGGSRKKSAPCPPIDRRNPFGMCRNHVESHLSTLTFEARASCVFADSEFDVPGLLECRRDRLNPNPKRHPLAPKTPPPMDDHDFDGLDLDRFVAVKSQPATFQRRDRLYQQWNQLSQMFIAAVDKTVGSTLVTILNHPNPVSVLLKKAIWQIQFLRRGPAVAIRIQRIFRGNRARRRVRGMGNEQAALRRIQACLKIQRLARGHIGRLAFAHELEAIQTAVPTIQRIVRGGLARTKCRRLRAVLCIQHNFRAYRQRCFAWALREEIEYMRGLQRQADANYDEMLVQLDAFRRLRARRVLRLHVTKWKHRKEEQARLALERIQALLSTVKIQRAYRRYQYYKTLKLRYGSAQQIQKRVRGWLTRHMWKDDPGLLSITSFVSPLSGFEYGKIIVVAQPSRSYSFPSRKVRMQFAALAIQRVHRGFMGRITSNMRWVAMLKRWEWLSMDSTGETSDSMTLGHQRYGFLLPSYNYHHDQSRHMLAIKRGIKADRGFAYKYQSVLKLIQDRDGKRAWSLVREEKWKRDQELAKNALKDGSRSPHREMADSSRPHKQRPGETIAENDVSMAKALYPIGCLVWVASTNRRDQQRFYKARVTAIHSNQSRETNTSTADVEYITSCISVRGVRVYHEPHVPLSRLRHVGLMGDDGQLNKRRRSVGYLIKDAIGQLKREIEASREKRQRQHTVNHADDSALDSVDVIADRLRDLDPRTDLLIDHRDFVNFVFLNSKLLKIKWLQVIDHVRYGTRDNDLDEAMSGPSNHPITPSVSAFYREFGFDSAQDAKAVVPMPERARDIEERMTILGFLHEPSANIKDEPEEKWIPKGGRPKTTPHDPNETHSVIQSTKLFREPRDDSVLNIAAAATASSAQDLLRLIYELKTLPRERHREEIIEVTTRHARSFICGYPACGRCFSSREAARLHQEGVHLHQRRLATATPLVDQYMHAYWPPKSPWNQEHNRSFVPSVGYFHCSRAECAGVQGEFRTRRELHHHMQQTHMVTSGMTQSTGSISSKTKTATETPAKPPRSSLIWLGTYSISRPNLERRIESFSPTASWHGSDTVICEVHRLTKSDPERCRDCFRQKRSICLPCRLYRTVALPGPRQLGQQNNEEQSNQMDGYTIFSIEDPHLCPVVREQDLIAVDEDEKDRQKRLMRQYARHKVKHHNDGAMPSTLVHLRILSLCRDENGVGWAIGHVFRPTHEDKTRNFVSHRSGSTPSDDATDIYEVTLDESHVVATALQDIRAVCIVHRCSSNVFLRKHFRKDDPRELRRLSEARKNNHTDENAGQQVHRLSHILERFWRIENTDNDPR